MRLSDLEVTASPGVLEGRLKSSLERALQVPMAVGTLCILYRLLSLSPASPKHCAPLPCTNPTSSRDGRPSVTPGAECPGLKEPPDMLTREDKSLIIPRLRTDVSREPPEAHLFILHDTLKRPQEGEELQRQKKAKLGNAGGARDAAQW